MFYVDDDDNENSCWRKLANFRENDDEFDENWGIFVDWAETKSKIEIETKTKIKLCRLRRSNNDVTDGDDDDDNDNDKGDDDMPLQ